MKLQIKTLNHKLMTVDIEPTQTVFDLKKELSRYPDVGVQPEFQKLIYTGKILSNSDQLGACNIDIKKFLVVMILKQPVAKTPLSEPKGVGDEASNNMTTNVEPILLPSNPESPRTDTASAIETTPQDSNKDKLVEQIVGMGYEEMDVRRALEASFNNPERAIEYLIEGMSVSIPNETDMMMDDDSENSEMSMYEMFRTDPVFQSLQSAIEHNPELVNAAIQQVGDSNPALLNFMGENQHDILSMLINASADNDDVENTEQASDEDSGDGEF